MTFSIAARCARTGMFGVALSSSSPAVGARCAFARAGVGSVTSQNVTDPRLGPAGIDSLAAGLSADAVIDALREKAGKTAPYRQLTAIDASGHAAAFSGEHALGRHGHHIARDVVAAGNMLASTEVPRAMVEAFSQMPSAHLADRLLDGLLAALASGGEEGAVHSATLLIVADQEWPLVDLRVDWSNAPIEDLAALWAIWQPQMLDYVSRGLEPAMSPRYGVPGDP